MELIVALVPVGAVIVGGGIATASAYLQNRWTATREARRREEEARVDRMRVEREVIADLIVALYGYLSSVINLKLAYDAAGRGAEVDVNRLRELQEVSQTFGPALIRARLTARNPATRPVLDNLEKQHIRMSGHLNLAALGQPAPEFLQHFRVFHRILSEGKVELERAALTYDGILRMESVQPKAGDCKPRQRRSEEEADGDGDAQLAGLG